jgi:hypothetical protein
MAFAAVVGQLARSGRCAAVARKVAMWGAASMSTSTVSGCYSRSRTQTVPTSMTASMMGRISATIKCAPPSVARTHAQWRSFSSDTATAATSTLDKYATQTVGGFPERSVSPTLDHEWASAMESVRGMDADVLEQLDSLKDYNPSDHYPAADPVPEHVHSSLRSGPEHPELSLHELQQMCDVPAVIHLDDDLENGETRQIWVSPKQMNALGLGARTWFTRLIDVTIEDSKEDFRVYPIDVLMHYRTY